MNVFAGAITSSPSRFRAPRGARWSAAVPESTPTQSADAAVLGELLLEAADLLAEDVRRVEATAPSSAGVDLLPDRRVLPLQVDERDRHARDSRREISTGVAAALERATPWPSRAPNDARARAPVVSGVVPRRQHSTKCCELRGERLARGDLRHVDLAVPTSVIDTRRTAAPPGRAPLPLSSRRGRTPSASRPVAMSSKIAIRRSPTTITRRTLYGSSHDTWTSAAAPSSKRRCSEDDVLELRSRRNAWPVAATDDGLAARARGRGSRSCGARSQSALTSWRIGPSAARSPGSRGSADSSRSTKLAHRRGRRG